MSEEVNNNQESGQSYHYRSPSRPIEPWSFEKDADVLMDEIFGEVDRLLDGGSPLPQKTVQSDYVSLQPVSVPTTGLRTAPSETTRPPAPAPTSRVRSRSTPRTQKTPTPSPKSKRGAFSSSSEKILLFILGASILGVLAWFIGPGRSQWLQIIPNQAVSPTPQPEGSQTPLSTADRQFIDYMKRALKTISSKPEKNPTGINNTIPPATTLSPANESSPQGIERIFIPVYPTNIPDPGAVPLPSPAPKPVVPSPVAPSPQPQATPEKIEPGIKLPAPPSPRSAKPVPRPTVAIASAAPRPNPKPVASPRANPKPVASPRANPKPVASPRANPKPVAVRPSPRPSPVAVRPSPRPSPVAARPSPRPSPKPVAARPSPRPSVAARPNPRPSVAARPSPRPSPVAARPSPRPSPKPVAARPSPRPVTTNIPTLPPAPVPQASIAATAAVNNYKLVGLLESGDRSAALFQIEGITQRITLGETIGQSGWTLVSANNQSAVIRRNGEVRSIYVGQNF